MELYNVFKDIELPQRSTRVQISGRLVIFPTIPSPSSLILSVNDVNVRVKIDGNFEESECGWAWPQPQKSIEVATVLSILGQAPKSQN